MALLFFTVHVNLESPVPCIRWKWFFQLKWLLDDPRVLALALDAPRVGELPWTMKPGMLITVLIMVISIFVLRDSHFAVQQGYIKMGDTNVFSSHWIFPLTYNSLVFIFSGTWECMQLNPNPWCTKTGALDLPFNWGMECIYLDKFQASDFFMSRSIHDPENQWESKEMLAESKHACFIPEITRGTAYLLMH